MQINVGQIVYSLEIGGLEKLVFDLISKKNDNRFRHTVFCLDNKGRLSEEFEKAGIEVIALNRRGRDPGLIGRLGRLLRDRKITIAHSHNLGPCLYGGLAARLAGVPIVIHTKHGTELEGRSWLSRISFMLPDRIITVSESAFRTVKREGWANKAVLIRNGVDLCAFNCADARPRDLRKKYFLPDGKDIIGTIGHLTAVKDIPTLIDSFRLLLTEMNDICLVVVGEGDERSLLESKVRKMGLSDKVFFLGSQRNIPEVMSMFSVFALSSLTEGNSIALMEAMACGLPVVVTNVGGNPELIKHGINGFVVEPKDRIGMKDAFLRLLKDKKLALGLGEENRRVAIGSCSIEETIKGYEKVYIDQLVARQGLR